MVIGEYNDVRPFAVFLTFASSFMQVDAERLPRPVAGDWSYHPFRFPVGMEKFLALRGRGGRGYPALPLQGAYRRVSSLSCWAKVT
jgi:hypothetical protein